MSNNPINRRQHERFRVNPGYTSTSVRVHPDEQSFSRSGHIYDLSEGGVCFELDCPIEPGSTISMQIDLPGLGASGDIGPGRAVFVTGNVVWTDTDEPGASRMALAITRYDRAGDRERLIRALGSSRFLRAA
ncbi:MAG: PilZ domain-containing protein [Phycisphaerales bacterium]|nr:PilZ domain-containing protein [Phycisphaerales bacterium]